MSAAPLKHGKIVDAARGLRIVGVDCAVKPENTGVAAAVLRGSRVEVTEVSRFRSPDDRAAQIQRLLKGWNRVLIAMDAPLGWPVELGRTLRDHRAGKPLRVDPDQLFRRETDRLVHRDVGKRPLDVGADRIARTAHAALKLLGEVGDLLGQEILLAWQPGFKGSVAVIEVYPAATLKAHGIEPRRYRETNKAARQRAAAARHGLVERLRRELILRVDTTVLVESPDALDAIICILAAADFLRGHCIAPEDEHRAKAEGWIWVRRPEP